MTDPARRTLVLDSAPPRPNGLAVAALVLGLVGLAVGVLPLIGLVLSALPTVLAIVLGVVGIARSAARASGFVPALLGLLSGLLTAWLWTTGYGLWW